MPSVPLRGKESLWLSANCLFEFAGSSPAHTARSTPTPPYSAAWRACFVRRTSSTRQDSLSRAGFSNWTRSTLASRRKSAPYGSPLVSCQPSTAPTALSPGPICFNACPAISWTASLWSSFMCWTMSASAEARRDPTATTTGVRQCCRRSARARHRAKWRGRACERWISSDRPPAPHAEATSQGSPRAVRGAGAGPPVQRHPGPCCLILVIDIPCDCDHFHNHVPAIPSSPPRRRRFATVMT